MILLLANTQRALLRRGSISARPDGILFRDGSLIAESTTPMEHTLLRDVIEFYLREFGTGNDNTSRAKRYDLQYFYEYCLMEIGPSPVLSDITRAHCLDYRDLRLGAEAPTTVSRRMRTLRHFFSIVANKYRDYSNPMLAVYPPKCDAHDPRCLSEAEKDAIRKHVTPGRNRLVIELGFLMGLRSMEITKLRRSDFSDDLRRCFVGGKDSYFARVPVNDKLIGYIKQYLPERAKVIGSKDPTWLDGPDVYPLVISPYGAMPGVPSSFELNEKTVWRIASEAGEKAGLKVWPHRFRHTFVRTIWELTKDQWQTQKLARHRSPLSMQPYSRMQVEEVRDTVNQLGVSRR